MLKRLCLGVVSAALLSATLLPVTTADASPHRGDAKRGVKLKASSTEVEEGDRLKLTAKVKGTGATRVTLQKHSITVFGDPEWVDVKSKAVTSKKRVKFRVVATGENSERYRASVAYRDGRSVRSKPVTVTVWRWIALSRYAPYYETPGAYFSAVAINGHTYNGYYTYSSATSWEARFTAGRSCKAFRAVLGVQDKSGDGSSGTIKLTADDAVVYESPVLTPGMDLTVTQALALPYRFGIQLFDTSPDGTKAWPALGEPALLCTGVA